MLRRPLTIFRLAVAFLTRLPGAHPPGATPADFVLAVALFPLVGLAIGAVIGVAFVGCERIGLPAIAAAGVSLGAGALLTGAVHEDGLADTVDGFGGGRDRQSKLDIMRDSRIGSYGTVAVVLSVIVKVGALSGLAGGEAVAALAFAHCASRGAPALVTTLLPAARRDGLGAATAGPGAGVLAVSLLTVVAAGAFLLEPTRSICACAAALVGILLVVIAARRQIGGFTGDVLGASQQIAEIAVMLALVARPVL